MSVSSFLRHHLYLAMILVSGGLLLSSCLGQDAKGLIDDGEASSSATSLYINSVASLYLHIGGHNDSEGLQGTYRGVYDYNTFTSDEALIPIRGGDWYDGGFWENLYLHRWKAIDLPLYNTWCYLYGVVVLCNESLERIEKHKQVLTATQLAEYKAEVTAIRDLYYFYLMDLYGDIPLLLDTHATVNQVKQTPRYKVFKWLVADLQELLPLLPEGHSQQEGKFYGRVTRPVVHFLLAKLLLNAEVYADTNRTDNVYPDGRKIIFTVGGQSMNAWQACIYYCNLLAQEGYRLADRYEDNFCISNNNSPENIFTIPMDKMLYANEFWYLYRSRHYVHGGALGMDAPNGASATVNAVKTYGYNTPQQDHRYEKNLFSDTLRIDGKVVLFGNGTPLVYKPLAVRINLTGDPYEKTAGARMNKYETDRKAFSDGKLQDNDIVLFRYADVLLMKAEAKVRNGQDGTAELNQVRKRVGMGTRTATLDNLLAERLMELHWEGWRRNDLIRYGRYDKAYDQRPQLKGEADHHTIVFPIPDRARQLNGNLHQNAGY